MFAFKHICVENANANDTNECQFSALNGTIQYH